MTNDSLVATAPFSTTTTMSICTTKSTLPNTNNVTDAMPLEKSNEQHYVTVARQQQSNRDNNNREKHANNIMDGCVRESNINALETNSIDGIMKSLRLDLNNNSNVNNKCNGNAIQTLEKNQSQQFNQTNLKYLNENTENRNGREVRLLEQEYNNTNRVIISNTLSNTVNGNIIFSTSNRGMVDNSLASDGIVPLAIMGGHGIISGNWYQPVHHSHVHHNDVGQYGGDESSGFYSGSGFSGSGSVAASCGAPADCSPPLSSCYGAISSAADYDTNFDDEFDQQLLKSTDPGLPGSRNVTESVEVPSSEHVAEIVGRQGCKIKTLRAKTNTYIKTPVRGEDPVFVVTGRHEDVEAAKEEIESAAEHFTQIRASRRHSQGGVPAPGHVTAYVRVPLRVVGLVVGPKGATIKRIQQDTHTYIITPSREREPIFEVTGLIQNVESARREIEQHIYQRTGNMPITDPNAPISNYEQNTVNAQAAAHAAVNSQFNRPNYGALAATNSVGSVQQHSQSSITPEYTRAHWQSVDYRTGSTFGGTPHANAFGGSMSLDSYRQQPQRFLQAQKTLFTQSCPVSAQSQSQQIENNFAFNNYDSVISVGTQRQAQSQQLVRSESTLQNDAAGWLKDDTYQPWSTNCGLNLHLDILSDSSSSAAASNNNNYFISSSGAGASTAIACGLSSVNSTSRDEGLGDSPINSLGKQQNDIFSLITSSIWSSNPIESIGNGTVGLEKLVDGETITAATSIPQQLATA